MLKIKNRILFSVCLFAVALGSVSPTLAQSRPDFSGKYARHVEKFHSMNKVGTATIEISQTAQSLELKYTEDGKSRTRTLKLDGSKTSETTPMGVMKEKVRFEGKTLIISTVLPGTAAEPGGTQEDVWQLSPDLKKLTMHSTLRVENKVVHEETRVYIRLAKPLAIAERKK
jgi:hypothetical protein